MKKNNCFYLSLIFLIWLVAYITWTLIFEQRLGWDEVSYLATAKGIAEDFDFSSRFVTVVGLIKYPFPQSTHHFPVYPIYLAIFLKLFGVSLKVAYFSTWLCTLTVCIFIYLTMLVLTEDDKLFSFVTSIAFLFLPTILHYSDTAMMEIPGCALISIFTHFIFKDLLRSKLNPVFMGIAAIWLYLYKSLFIGAVFGFLSLILITYNSKFTDIKIKSKLPVYLSVAFFISTFLIIYFIFTKFVFLPLAPMMCIDKSAVINETYADFAGGFFYHPIANAIINFKGFFTKVVSCYFPSFPTMFYPERNEGFWVAGRTWSEFGLFVIVLFYVITFLVFYWKKLSPLNRTFILFALISIFAFNMIFNLMAISDFNQRSRHNMLYLPLLLMSVALIVKSSSVLSTYRNRFVIISFLVLVYLPFYVAQVRIEDFAKKSWHGVAHKHSEIISKFIGNTKPSFIYFVDGTQTVWDSYPTRVILQEMTNKQLDLLNSKLPGSVEYLFLKPHYKLAVENLDLILKGKPIVNNTYSFVGYDEKNKIVVYKYNKQANNEQLGEYEKK